MRALKQWTAVLTVLSILTLPLGVMGCASEAPPAGGGAGTGDAASPETDMESDLGEPESGTNL